MSRNCAHCGTPLKENALFCGTCGALNKEQKTCPQCGTMLDDDLNFCIACGAHVSSAKPADDLISNAASTAPFARQEPIEPPEDIFAGLSVNTALGAPAEPEEDLATPLDASVYAGTSAHAGANTEATTFPSAAGSAQSVWQPLGQLSDERQLYEFLSKPGLIAIIIAAILIAGTCIALAVTQPWMVSQPQPAAATVQPEEEDDSDESPAPEEDAEEEEPPQQNAATEDKQLDEMQIYTELTRYYSLLAGFEERVKECATEFNGAFSNSDMPTRTVRADTAKALHGELTTLYFQLKELKVPYTSVNYQSYDNTCTLYNDLIQRVTVLCEAWDVSLLYSTPADHTDAILAPVGRDNVGGVNKFKTEYESLYPHAAPKEPKQV